MYVVKERNISRDGQRYFAPLNELGLNNVYIYTGKIEILNCGICVVPTTHAGKKFIPMIRSVSMVGINIITKWYFSAVKFT